MSGEYLRKSVEVSKGIVGTFVLCAACAATDTIGRMWTSWIVATVSASAHAMTRNRFTEDLLGMPCYTLPPVRGAKFRSVGIPSRKWFRHETMRADWPYENHDFLQKRDADSSAAPCTEDPGGRANADAGAAATRSVIRASGCD